MRQCKCIAIKLLAILPLKRPGPGDIFALNRKWSALGIVEQKPSSASCHHRPKCIRIVYGMYSESLIVHSTIALKGKLLARPNCSLFGRRRSRHLLPGPDNVTGYMSRKIRKWSRVHEQKNSKVIPDTWAEKFESDLGYMSRKIRKWSRIHEQKNSKVIPDTWAEKFESFERINSIGETNGNINSRN